MNIRDLQYLVAVAELNHFGQAAEKCFVSQPTLSTQLKKLEDELSVLIFERNNKTVFLTEQGEVLVNQARHILNEVKKLKQLAINMQNPLAGPFRLGVIPTIGPYLLPLILAPIKKELPELDLIVHENTTENLLLAMKKGDLDAIILALPVAHDGMVAQELFQEPFYLAVEKHNPLAKKPQIKVSDLENEKLLLLQEGHCLREQALEACHMISAQTEEGFTATSLETLRHIVASGTGVTLLPALAIHDAKKDKALCIKPFVKPMPARRVGMLWRKTSVRSVCAEKIKILIIDSVASEKEWVKKSDLKILKKELS